METTELAIRAGVDRAVRDDGSGWMESMVRTEIEIAYGDPVDFRIATDTEFFMVAGVFFLASDWHGVCGDCQSGRIVDGIRLVDMEDPASLGVAVHSLPGLGDLCGGAELQHLDDELTGG